jgi:GH18 family chitinase
MDGKLQFVTSRLLLCFLVQLFVLGVSLQLVTSKKTKLDTVKNLANETSDFVVSAYLPEYRFANLKIDQLAEHITDLILFSAEPLANGDLAMMSRFPTEVMDAVGKVRASKGLRVFLCVGGGGRSAGFSSLSSNAATRRKFGLKLLDACRKMGLDGVDLDWEGDLESDPKKWNDFGLLLNDINELFKTDSKNGDAKLLLSIAIHVGQEAAVTPDVIKVRLHWHPHYSQAIA